MPGDGELKARRLSEVPMWSTVIVVLVAAALIVYVGVRQARHPSPPGKPMLRSGDADPDSRDWSGPPTGSGF
jgi:hypothetical protein